MLQIGLTRALAMHLGKFRAAGLSQWSDFTIDLQQPRLDLILDQAAGIPHGSDDSPEHFVPVIHLDQSYPDSAAALVDTIQNALADQFGFVVGYGEAMHEACRWIRSAAHDIAGVIGLRTLVVGETGVGKELAARAIHRLGRRHQRRFVAVNCAAIASALVGSELFGHVRGAFTGADTHRDGAFATAESGSLFLDEVGDLPPDVQGTLLRVLDQGEFQPVGSDVRRPLRAQIIAATNRSLSADVAAGRFRPDLYFRLNQIPILLPPLRERRFDIPLLIERTLRRLDSPGDVVSPTVREAMMAHNWPGNIRELVVFVERIVLMSRSGHAMPTDPQSLFEPGMRSANPPITHSLATEASSGSGTSGKSLAERREDFDRQVLEEVLRRNEGDTARAAQELGITRRAVYTIAKRLRIRIKPDVYE